MTDTASTSVSTPTTVDTAAADTGLAPVRVPDFALKDRNPTSASFDELVSPRDQIGRVSVWYFGHST